MMPDKKDIKNSANSALLAEQILQGMVRGDEKPIPSPTPNKIRSVPNLKNIEVPEHLVESIVNFAKGNKEEVIQDSPVELNEEVVVQNKMSDLVQRLSSLLKEAKQFINELNSTGMIGGSLSPFHKARNKKKI